MIGSIHIENFQSHQDTFAEFSDGVNAFTGNSDCGKSAAVRALLWCVTNSPSGDAFVSDWAKDSKGKVRFPCKVSVKTNGVNVCREKSKDFNGYNVDGVVYEALRTDVPKDVSDSFNLGEVNIQRQMDGMFLLSMTAGERARYINELVKLDEIDKVSSAVASLKRETVTRQNYVKGEIDKNEAILAMPIYKGIDEAADKVARLRELDKELLGLSEHISTLSNGISLYTESVRVRDSLGSSVESLVDKMGKAERLIDEIKVEQSSVDELNESLSVHSKASAASKYLGDTLSKVNAIVPRIESLEGEIDALVGKTSIAEDIAAYKAIVDKADALSRAVDVDAFSRLCSLHDYIVKAEGENESLVAQIEGYDELVDSISDLPSRIGSLMERLGTMVCPLCGRVGCKE